MIVGGGRGVVGGLRVGESPAGLAMGWERGRPIAIGSVTGGERPACYALGRERGRPKAFGSVTGGVEEVVAGRSEGGWE